MFGEAFGVFDRRLLIEEFEERVLKARGLDIPVLHWRRSVDVRPIRRPDRAIVPAQVRIEVVR